MLLLRVSARRHLVKGFSTMSETSTELPGPVEISIRTKLITLFKPKSIRITNDSWQHRHHAAMRENSDNNKETHFSIEIISNAFEKKPTIQRHRMIYSALSDHFATGLHAVSLKTNTEAEATTEF